MKEYKTNEELINFLKQKNIIFKNENEALNIINKYGYYSIINSYKQIFKNSDGSYKENVSFEEIYSLFIFDKNIKHIFLKYILEIELIIRNLLGNQISKVYSINDYLNVNKLDDKVKLETREKIIEKINKSINESYGMHNAITHYKDKYGFIPPFVLVKILTFGVISSYYGVLKQSDKQAISKYFKISDNELKGLLKCLTTIRNKSAHSDLLFCYRDKQTLSFKKINSNYKNKDNTTNLYMVIKLLTLLLEKETYNNFISELDNEINKLEKNLTSIKITDVLTVMGYDNV